MEKYDTQTLGAAHPDLPGRIEDLFASLLTDSDEPPHGSESIGRGLTAFIGVVAARATGGEESDILPLLEAMSMCKDEAHMAALASSDGLRWTIRSVDAICGLF